MEHSQRPHGRFIHFVTILFSLLSAVVTAQNSPANTTVAPPYSAIFDTEVYNDGTGVDLAKNLDQPTVVAVNVPEGDNQDDLFIHFSAPADGFSWAGFGFGSGMANSLIFVVYRSEGNSSSITVSPRIGKGHVMPQFTSDVNITTFDPTGIDKNNRFVLNMQCTNCRSWHGGKVTVGEGSETQPVFYALGPQGNLQSDDQNTPITQHGRNSDALSLYLVPGTPGVPIVDGDPSETQFIAGQNTTNAQNGPNSINNGEYQSTRWSLAVHAFFMCFAFAIVFPGGFLLLRLFDMVWLHWIPQSIGVLVVIGGLAAGIYGSRKYDEGFSHPHQIFGFVIVFFMIGTWTLGFLGHQVYKRTQTKSPLMKFHRIAGPLVIFSGLANVFIGFAWVGSVHILVTFAGLLVVEAVVITSLLFWKRKRDMRKAAMNSQAASNFREGNENGFGHGPAVYYGNQPPPVPSFAPQPGNGIQMQTFYPNK